MIYLSATLCLILVSAATEGFFLPGYRKQAPHAAPWTPSPTAAIVTTNSNTNSLNTGTNTGQQTYAAYKDYGTYGHQSQAIPTTQHSQPQSTIQPIQQGQQSPQINQQQQPQAQIEPQVHTAQYLQQIPQTASKYDSSAYNFYNQQQFAYEGGYGPYPQNVQLFPCLCPVNKDIIEQQQLLQQQQQIASYSSGDSAKKN